MSQSRQQLAITTQVLIAGAALLLGGCFFGGGGDDSEATPTVTPNATSKAVPTSTAVSTPSATATPRPDASLGPPFPPPAPGTFGQTGPLVTDRHLHTATLLEDGRVLVVGGSHALLGVLDSAELYDATGSAVVAQEDGPDRMATGAFEATGSMEQARQTHAATRLADGRVLITGGIFSSTPGQGPLASAEVYDPETGRFASTGSMATARLGHGSTLLADGRVLVVGGSGNPYIAAAELYDPATGVFVPGGEMAVGRLFVSLVHLPEGRVLVHGAGFGERVAPEIYDPATQTFTLVDTPEGIRWPSQAIGLLDGTVLFTGDCCGDDGSSALPTAVLFDPVTNEVIELPPMHDGRFAHRLALLADGRVLLAGGQDAALEGVGGAPTSEVFDPATRNFEVVGPMSGGRRWHTATTLDDGQVLVIGEPDGEGRTVDRFAPPARETRAISGLFTEPREMRPDVVLELGPRPPSPFEPWNREDVVLYDLETMTEQNLGQGVSKAFSPDGTRFAWTAGRTSFGGETWVLDLETGERASFGEGLVLWWHDDVNLYVQQQPGNRRELLDVETGLRRPIDEALIVPPWDRPVEAGGFRLQRLEQGEYPAWSSLYLVEDISGARLPIRFDAHRAVLAPDGTVFVSLPPGEPSGPDVNAGPHIETGLANIFEVDLKTGEATFIATALGTAPGFPFVASNEVVAWTDDACGLRDGSPATLIFDRASGTLTELRPAGWPNAAVGDQIGFGVFGATALFDTESMQYSAVLPDTANDVVWSSDQRYAALSSHGGHGGPC